MRVPVRPVPELVRVPVRPVPELVRVPVRPVPELVRLVRVPVRLVPELAVPASPESASPGRRRSGRCRSRLGGVGFAGAQ